MKEAVLDQSLIRFSYAYDIRCSKSDTTLKAESRLAGGAPRFFVPLHKCFFPPSNSKSSRGLGRALRVKNPVKSKIGSTWKGVLSTPGTRRVTV